MAAKDLLLFQTIFEQTPVSTQIFTLDGETVMVNKAWEKLWQTTFAELKSYNILKDEQLVTKGLMPLIRKAFTGERVHLPIIEYVPAESVSVKHIVPYRWLHATMYPIRDVDKKLTHVVLQHEDITERKEAEDAKYRLAAIVESSDDAIVSKSLQGIITSWNSGAERIFGYKEKEVIGKHISLIIPKRLLYEEDEIIRNLKAGKRIEHFETQRVRKDKQEISVSLTISPVKNDKGEIVGASKIARDVTAQKKTEHSLLESEERLRLALDAGKIGVWDWDIVHDTLNWTENVYHIHGVEDRLPLTLHTFQDLIHPDDKKKVLATIDETLKGKKNFDTDFRIITPGGETKWVSTKAIATYASDGTPIRLLGAVTDISEQKRLEQEKSDFLSMASHELKTPLTSMKIFIELLHAEVTKINAEKPGYLVGRVRDQANRLAELTGDLLDVSRIETGKLRLNKEDFDITELVSDTVEGIQPSTLVHQLLIKGRIKENICADRYRIYQVLVNLLTNAIKYSPEGEKIIITLKDHAREVEISVQDFGIGIKKEQLEKVFDRLYQVTDPEEKTYPGLGLGLYISKEIVERHKGKIWAESEGKHTSKEKRGSTFYFTLPKKEKAE